MNLIFIFYFIIFVKFILTWFKKINKKLNIAFSDEHLNGNSFMCSKYSKNTILLQVKINVSIVI